MRSTFMGPDITVPLSDDYLVLGTRQLKNVSESNPMGVRIPKEIKGKFDKYCDRKNLRKI